MTLGSDDARVQLSVTGAVATITLDSPANRNALSKQLTTEVHEALDRAEAADVRAIVLTHTGSVFCAGVDLKERAAGPPDSAPMVGIMERLRDASVPTIAALTGPVRAGGVGIMAACDLVVVHPNVTFAFTEVRIGVAPAIISVPILARCSWNSVAAAFLTGEVFDAAFAQRIGLVSHVEEDVGAAVDRLVAGILASAPEAVGVTKRILRNGPAPMADMRIVSDRLFQSAEAAEGMRAFNEKRSPNWAPEG